MLYVANCTKQTLVHYVRLPESQKSQVYEIPSGQQIQMGRDWTQAQQDHAIQHMKKFGFKEVSDLSRGLDDFDGYVYSTKKPLSEDDINMAHSAVVENQERRSADEAIKAGKSFDLAGRDKRNKSRRLAKLTEVEVVEDLPPREKPTGDEVNFKLSVTDETSADVKATRRK